MDWLVVGHVVGGIGLLGTGVAAALAPKRRRTLHPRVGRVYVVLLVLVLGSGMVIGARRPGLSPFEIATPPTLAMGLLGFLAARRPLRGRLGAAWKRWHIVGMGSSLIGVVTATAFQLVPPVAGTGPVTVVAIWVVPSVVGSALIGRAVARRAVTVASPTTAARARGRPTAAPTTAAPTTAVSGPPGVASDAAGT